MDRCALFVDAGYVLADGGMAVHGTRRRESVSWDYAGLLNLFGSLATERSGLPLLRCYWYEATVEGRRSADHDTLADLPGVKLRLAKMRPGRREGVEGQIHRDLETLARNRAVSDAVVVSADEDLAEVIAGVQDLGMRVTLLHIAVDGDWTISRALRQECDDIAEISSELLRPYAELISGAEPPHPDEQQDQQDSARLIALRPTVAGNGHGQAARTGTWGPPPAGQDNGHQPPGYDDPARQGAAQAGQDVAPARQDVPQVGQHAAQVGQDTVQAVQAGQAAAQGAREQQAAPADVTPPAARVPAGPADAGIVQAEALPALPARHAEAAPPRQPEPVPVWQPEAVPLLQPEALPPRQPEPVPVRQVVAPPLREEAARARQEPTPARQPAAVAREAAPDMPVRPDMPLYAAPVGMPAPAQDQPADLPAARSWQPADLSGYVPGAPREQSPRDMIREPLLRAPLSGDAGDGLHALPGGQGSAQIRHLPSRGAGSPAQPHPAQPHPAHQAPGQQGAGHPMAPGAGYAPGHNGSYSGPQPAVPPVPPGAPGAPATPGLSGLVAQPAPIGPAGVPTYTPAHAPNGAPSPAPSGPIGAVAYPGGQPSVSLAEAVQSAHDEGQDFGSSIARDAPALWLEAVLARKPRMPSDLEARLLQGSALPIDFLLHDEVRHALRRGFWDALERARRLVLLRVARPDAAA